MFRTRTTLRISVATVALLAASACATDGQTASTYAAPMISAAAPEQAAIPARDPVVDQIADMEFDIPYTRSTCFRTASR